MIAREFTDRQHEAVRRLKDPKFFLENHTKIKGKKAGHLISFRLNEAQKDLFNTLKRYARVIILKARQLGFCCQPSQKVLTADLRWVAVDDLRIGDEIVAVDENYKSGKGNSRKMRKAVVENKFDVFSEALRIEFEDGRELVLTPEHRMLCRKWGKQTEWKEAGGFTVGDEIRYVTKPWGEPDYEDGWFSGMIDGEGSLAKKSRSGGLMGVSQVDGPVWNRVVSYLDRNGYDYRVEKDCRKAGDSSKLGSKTVNKAVIGRLDEIIRLVGLTRPSRFVNRCFWEGKSIPNNGWEKIVRIEKLPKQRMVDLQTSEKTYIPEGFVSHNSTGVVGYFYHRTIFTPSTNTALIGYNSELTAERLDKIKTLWRTTPEKLRPSLRYNSKYEISFPILESKVIVLPASKTVGRGYTLHNCLATEAAFWDDAEEKLAILEASVPEDGKLVIETTPSTVGTAFHKKWSVQNDYAKKEYGWWWGYTREEVDKIRRNMADDLRFFREYELEFDSTGMNVFPREIIRAQRKFTKRLNDSVELANGETWTVRQMMHGLRVYRPPESGVPYVIGADIAEGVEGGDYSVAVVINRYTGEEVAFWRGHVAPDRFGEMLNDWGRYYNTALVAPEVNNHGLTTVTILKQKFYPNVYVRPKKFDVPGLDMSQYMGWKTTQTTRPIMLDDFQTAVRDQSLIIRSKEILDEMMVFVYNKNMKAVAEEGWHDDTIFAAGIGVQALKMIYVGDTSQIDYSSHMPSSTPY